MGGQLVAVVVIAGGEGNDLLVGLADIVERLADVGERRLSAAGENVEIERDYFDPIVLRRLVERMDDVA
jgi:hypothetical protein